jgi:hypothetical protein
MHGARVRDAVISDSMFRLDRVPIGDEPVTLMAERSDVRAQEVLKARGIRGFQDVGFLGEIAIGSGQTGNRAARVRCTALDRLRGRRGT